MPLPKSVWRLRLPLQDCLASTIKNSLLLHSRHIVKATLAFKIFCTYEQEKKIWSLALSNTNWCDCYRRSQLSFSSSWHCLYLLLSYFHLLHPCIDLRLLAVPLPSLISLSEMVQNTAFSCLHSAYWGMCQHQLKAEGRSTSPRVGRSSFLFGWWWPVNIGSLISWNWSFCYLTGLLGAITEQSC